MLSAILTMLLAAQVDAPAAPETIEAESGKILVVYYSWTGTTQRVAEALAEEFGADLERIRDVRGRSGLFGYIRSGYEAVRSILPPIKPPEKDPADYDLVILGTPVWGGRMSSPMRSYIMQNQSRFNAIAMFSTHSGETEGETFRGMAALCDLTPVATLSLRREAVEKNAYPERLAEFVDEVRAALGN